jgi:predicted peptidase
MNIAMKTRRNFLMMTAIGMTAARLPADAQQPPVTRSATAITQVFGDGVKLIAVAVEYGQAIDEKSLSSSTFRVDRRTVTAVFPSASPDPSRRSSAGRFVVATLSPDDPEASLAQKIDDPNASGPPKGAGAGGPGKAGEIAVSDTAYHSPEAVISQVEPMRTSNGIVIPAAGSVALGTTMVRSLIADDFLQFEFKDASTGRTLPYNLFAPKDYDPTRSYPLVVFMHDAGATSTVTRTTLFQGLGAVAWASPADQAARPAFVLAPQYGEIIADDDSRTSSMLDTTINLIKALETQYSIDGKRIYVTGQSGGCMMAIAMNIKYPDFFAAAFLVAGQWDPALVKPLAAKNLWILVSQDDDKAWSGQTAITAVLAKEGAKISRAVWDGTWSASQFHEAFVEIDSERNPINFVAFQQGTVVPPGQSSAGASGHRNTWRIAYSIPEIRDWVFRHHL